MEVRSVRDLQVAARSRRLELGLTQQELADKARVSRKWLVGFEGGSASAVELALVLRLFAALDVPVLLGDTPATEPAPTAQPLDLNMHLARLADLAGPSLATPGDQNTATAAQRVAQRALASIQQAARAATALPSPAALAESALGTPGALPLDAASTATRAIEALRAQAARESPDAPEPGAST